MTFSSFQDRGKGIRLSAIVVAPEVTSLLMSLLLLIPLGVVLVTMLVFALLRRLSCALGHVQFFSVNRALNHHAWVWMKDRDVRRAYAWAGETLWNP